MYVEVHLQGALTPVHGDIESYDCMTRIWRLGDITQEAQVRLQNDLILHHRQKAARAIQATLRRFSLQWILTACIQQ